MDALSNSLTLLINQTSLNDEVKKHCKLGLKVIGIILTDLKYDTGTHLLMKKEFDQFFASFPAKYYNKGKENREYINLKYMKENKNEFTLKDYKQLFESLYPQLCVFAYKYNDLETSKDIVQEVFVKVWEDSVPFQDENHRTRYFYEIVKNKCLTYLKTKHHYKNLKIDFSNIRNCNNINIK